jgi:hypothetical protein
VSSRICTSLEQAHAEQGVVAELLLELHHGELDGGHLTAVMMHATWAIWKERNMRIFEGRSVQPVQVFRFIKDEMAPVQGPLEELCSSTFMINAFVTYEHRVLWLIYVISLM